MANSTLYKHTKSTLQAHTIIKGKTNKPYSETAVWSNLTFVTVQ